MIDWTYEQDGLVVTASRAGGKARIHWSGVSDSRSPSAFLVPVEQELLTHLRDAEVTVDFSQLEYMNSATVAPMLSLIKGLDAIGKPIVVIFSTADWQRPHLKCMTAVARTLKNVTIEGRAQQ